MLHHLFDREKDNMKRIVLLGLLACLAAVVTADEDMSMALKYLNQFHYISPSRSGNHNVKTAIANLQKFAGIPVTGELDPQTIEQMKTPRCGDPDVDGNGMRMRAKRYTHFGKTFDKLDLQWHLQYGADLSHSIQDRVIARALKYWTDICGIKFNRTYNAKEADVKISFGRYSHQGDNDKSPCPYSFDGQGGTLAHAFYPRDGRVHFDEDERFTDGTKEGRNLLWVATHEFGHTLGLMHSNVRDAVMYPWYTGYVENMELKYDDILGVQLLYGSNPNPPPTEAPTTAPSRPTKYPCVDKHKLCPAWAEIYCGKDWYVIHNCKKSCNECV